jgi:hypothetical protein
MKINKTTMVSIAMNAILAISLMIVLVNNAYPFLQMTPDGGGGGSGKTVKIDIATNKFVIGPNRTAIGGG